jgi:soluble lytic murein transglycosylase-like protein
MAGRSAKDVTMNTITSTIPYLFTYSPSESDYAEPSSVRATGGLPFLALFASLLLLTAHAPDAGMVPASEILPLNDSLADLSLSEVVARFEAHIGANRRQEAYRLGKLVLELSERHQLSPSLILAVIDTESSFRFGVVSKAGAVGLMQLLPDTAAEIARMYRIRSYRTASDLENPAVNLRLGVAYLAYLRHQFGNSLHTVAAYNAGPTAFHRRLRGGNFELGALDPYVRVIHLRARELRGSHNGAKLLGLMREEALIAASL